MDKFSWKNKFLTLMCATLLAGTSAAREQGRLDLQTITSGELAPAYITGINPIAGTDLYAQVSADGRQIVSRSFKTGRQRAVLFDVAATEGEHIDAFDGYEMDRQGRQLLIRTRTEAVYRRSYKAEFYRYDIATRRLSKLSEGGPQQVPAFSPDGRKIAFVRDNNLFVVADGHERQVTTDGRFNEIINGIPDWVNEEEFGFNRAFAFNADGTRLCWLRYDESRVKTYALQLFKGECPEREALADYPGEYSYKYPKAGYDNSVVSAWSCDLGSGEVRRLQVPLAADGYMPRIKATADSRAMIVYTMNRHQDTLCLYRADPATGLSRLLISESVPRYVKEEAMEGITVLDRHILVPSDRDGYMHLYLYDMEGRLLRQVERGDYDVTAVCGFDERRGDVYYQAARLNAHDRQVYVTRADGRTERLTDREGNNSAVFSADLRYFVNVWSDYDHPYVFTLRTNGGKTLAVLEDNHKLAGRLADYGFGRRETFSFVTSEGVRLDGWMVKPTDFDPSRRYPVILYQYSGPGSQQVINAWSTGSMGQGGAFDHYLAQQGFIVACVDGRGTGGRGAEFEKVTYLKLGELEARDQVETALYLGTLPYVDKDNIGIWGWSFGGFCTLMSMSEGRGVFKAGVAVAPPTNWKFYDTIYTERYMRTPRENAEGYKTNPIERADRLHGSLLICHGLADDNVHPQNAFEYSEALVQADKDFKENFYVNRNHGIRGGNTRMHLLRQISQWFERELK